ncbi:MAG: hypothetical protein IJU98_04280 [Synergistaceae bacterium]|nr:hypothetical protein [Synergistaceae bacterium]
MKKLLGLFVFVFLLSLGGSALAAEQRAFALKDPVTLYSKMDMSSKSWEVSLPENGVKVPSANRDKQNRLWYKVTVNGKTGWLFNEGIRLRMGSASKFAANVYNRCAKVRANVVKGKAKGWSEGETIGNVVTWVGDGALFQVQGKQDLYFKVTGSSASKDFLGFDAIGMSWPDLRKKAGTPTVRETPDGEPDARIISYELSGRNMTLAFHIDGDEVQWFELYQGKTGEATEGLGPDVLYEREQI